MDLILFKNSLDNFVQENSLVLRICQKMNTVPNVQTLKYDLEVIKYIANVVENELTKHTEDEKKDIIVKVLKSLFLAQPFSDAETITILSQITYLIKNKQIKKTSYKKYIYKTVGTWICKRFS